jgi:spore coat polysaccharide biosynthesis protein SpsF (cytidylyltransferase family)
VDTASEYNASSIVRITGDCPVIDPTLVDEVVQLARSSSTEYCSNVEPPTYPNGLDVEVFSKDALHWADKETSLIEDREHVTTALRRLKITTRSNLLYPEDHSLERWTLDTREDLEVIRNIFKEFSGSNCFSWLEILDLVTKKPELFAANRHLVRNHGLKMTAKEKTESANSSRTKKPNNQV